MGFFSKAKKALKKTVKAVGNVVTGGALKKKEQAEEKAKQLKAAAQKQAKQVADQTQNREIQQFADVSQIDQSRDRGGLPTTAITGLGGDMSVAQIKKKRLLGS